MVNDDFGQREIGTLYNLSMMLRVDEIDKDKHMNMTYVEFLEGIGRLAERLKLPMLVEEGSNKIKQYESLMNTVSFPSHFRKYSQRLGTLPSTLKVRWV